VLNASDIRSREDALAEVYAAIGERHNNTGLTERVDRDCCGTISIGQREC
jgi:hypothetical protein